MLTITIQKIMPFLSIGLVFGFSAGISPGPLFALVISESLRHGSRAGIQVACAPLISDSPIILSCYFLLLTLADISGFLIAISVLGIIYLVYLGIQSVRTRTIEITGVSLKKHSSLSRGILVNILNPHPYIFWLTIGSPTIIRAHPFGLWAVAAFLAGFYSSLVSSKCILALITGTSKKFISSKFLVRLNQIMGVVLILLAGLLLVEVFLERWTKTG
jgi:threonine/homoserine/homoserine lactone efflux protein